MLSRRSMFGMIALLALSLLAALPRAAGAQDRGYQTALLRWRAADGGFHAWERSGVVLSEAGALLLDPATAAQERDPYGAEGYHGAPFYNGDRYLVGEALSPMMPAAFAFAEAIPSWNADTPAGTWLETLVRVQHQDGWSDWYNLGVWAADDSTIQRHSVAGQRDDLGRVAVDTLIWSAERPAIGYQLKLRLFSLDGGAVPTVRAVALSLSTAPAPAGVAATPGNPRLWGRTLAVPECSQMVYPGGGEVWCSPTSLAMVQGYWRGDSGPCEPRVRAAVAATYDSSYDGNGNWPFNAAAAAAEGMEGYIARFTSLAQAEPWIAAGVPLLFSIGWGRGELSGAPFPSSSGHIAVLVGFDAQGNPVVNDPAAPADSEVQRVYQRAELERLWLEHSGGTVYLIYPQGAAVPALRAGDMAPALRAVVLRIQQALLQAASR